MQVPRDGVEVPEYRQSLIIDKRAPEPPRGLVLQDCDGEIWQYAKGIGWFSWDVEGPWEGIEDENFPMVAANPEDEPNLIGWDSNGHIWWLPEADREAIETAMTQKLDVAEVFSGTSTEWLTKDSGERVEFETGMKRDTNKGKPRFDLLWIKDMPYEEQPLYRLAMLMARGAEKYDDRNWEKASTAQERERYSESRLRHTAQSDCGLTDEDHDVAVMFNCMGKILVDWRLRDG